MSKDKKKKKSGSVGFFALAFLVGCVFGFLSTIWFSPYLEKHGVPFFVELLVIFVTYWLQIIIHEAGHLVFGLATGYGFSSFRILGFILVKTKGKLRLRKYSLAGTGGQCLLIPPNDRDGKEPFVLYNMGGCIMNFLSAACFITVFLFCDNMVALSVFAVNMCIVGMFVGLLNGIPLTTGMMPNDGMNTYHMLKERRVVKAMWNQLRINESMYDGVRLGDMPEEWFSIPSDEEMKYGQCAAIAVLAANRLLDKHRFAETAELIHNLLNTDNGLIEIHSNSIKCDLLYIELITENRADTVTSLMSKKQKEFMDVMDNSPFVQRVYYTLALRGYSDMKTPEYYREQFEKIARKYPYPSEIVSERELMAIAKDRILGENHNL